jgi:hypothetical protein
MAEIRQLQFLTRDSNEERIITLTAIKRVGSGRKEIN